MKRVLAIILGGGAGTRLYPLTKMRAKPAVPLAGKYRRLYPISNCINFINKMYVMAFSASLNRHLSQSFNLRPFGQGCGGSGCSADPHSPWVEGPLMLCVYQFLPGMDG